MSREVEKAARAPGDCVLHNRQSPYPAPYPCSWPSRDASKRHVGMEGAGVHDGGRVAWR